MARPTIYISENWKWIITSIFVGQCLLFWITPYILANSWVKKVLSFEPSLTHYFFVGILFFLILTHLFKHSLAFWLRYKNNLNLTKIPFTYADGIFIFLVSMATFPFHKQIMGSFSDGLKLLIVILGTIFLIWYIVIICKTDSIKPSLPQRGEGPSDTDFFPDEPITYETGDKLDRKPFIQAFYNQIVSYPFQDSFVFGLYGAWGEGKTSILNLLKIKLAQNDNIILFNFDPWYFSSQEALIKGFYQGLYSAINRTFFLPNIKTLLNNYQKILSSGLKLSGVDIDMTQFPESLEEQKEKIQGWISSTGKKIVIIIDDIDRLKDRLDILLIFKIAKLSGNFRNTIYVMSFDPNIILSHLKTDVLNDPSFLEKIIQSPVHLPAIEQVSIDRFLFYSYPKENHYSEIDRLLRRIGLELKRDKASDEFSLLYENQIKQLFPTLRAAKRYLNGLYSTLPSIKTEVNLYDYLIIELIRVFYTEVYNDIKSHPWYYIPTRAVSPLSFVVDENERYLKIEDHIKQVLSDQREKEVLLELLKTIFFMNVKNAFIKVGRRTYHNLSPYRFDKRITHPDVFPKYFMLRVPSIELSDGVVESLIDTWNQTHPTALELKFMEDVRRFKAETKLLELLERLIILVPRFGQDTSVLIINSISNNINEFSKKGRMDWFSESEFFKAGSFMLSLVNEKVQQKHIEGILIEIIEHTPSFDFATQVVVACRKDSGGDLFNISENIVIQKLYTVLCERLSNHFIRDRNDIFEEEKESYGKILYNWGTAGGENKEIVNEYVFSLVEKTPKYLGKMFSFFVFGIDSKIGAEIRYKQLIELYDETRLYNKVKEYYENAYSTQEEKGALDLFIQVHDQN
jgi:hypothetical protein